MRSYDVFPKPAYAFTFAVAPDATVFSVNICSSVGLIVHSLLMLSPPQATGQEAKSSNSFLSVAISERVRPRKEDD